MTTAEKNSDKNSEKTREQKLSGVMTEEQVLAATVEKVVPMSSITLLANPRTVYDKAALEELADSIEKHGQIQAVVVRQGNGPDAYDLIAGTRRFKAIGMLAQRHPEDKRWKSIRVSIQNNHKGTALKVVQTIENIRRADLSVLELSAAITDLKADGLLEQQIADDLGYSKDHVNRLLKIGESPSWLRQFGDKVEVDEVVVDDAGVKVLDKDGKPQFKKKSYAGFGFADLYEIVRFYLKVDLWDRKQQDSNPAHRAKSEAETRRLAKKAATGPLTGDKLKALTKDRFAELTGAAPPSNSKAADAAAQSSPVKYEADKRLTIDLAAVKSPLSPEDLQRIKPDLTAALKRLGFETITLR